MDIYAAVTERIIEQMEQGIIPWQKPWISNGKAVSHATGKPYSLLNQLMLGRPGEYLTFKQCQEAGGKVKKGEKASMVVFWKFIEQEDEETHEKKEIPFLRYYNVFHIDQCEGISAKYTTEAAFPDGADTLAAAQDIIYDYLSREGVKLSHEEGDRAFYRPSTDEVVLPIRKQFMSTAEYYSTVFHELTHSTGHPSRLNRLTRPSFFGTEDYSKEELVAEIGAATLVNHVGLETASSFRNSTAYIQNWLGVLKGDKRFIVSAAGRAEKAVNLILKRLGQETRRGAIPVGHGGNTMNIEDDFMWIAGNAFSEMRLMVEGAITLFEDDAGVLCRLAREAQKNEAQLALNDIGTALYSFRNHIKTLQAAHHKAATQEPEEAKRA